MYSLFLWDVVPCYNQIVKRTCERNMNPKVDKFLDRADQWHDEYEQLRTIILECDLKEDFKWGKPCYTDDGDNILLMHGFKDFCALLFFKGVLMEDPAGLLVAQTENVQATRQIRFTDADEIVEMAHIIKAYVQQAIEVERSGAEVDYKETTEFNIPEELQNKFDEAPDFKDAFEALTPGRQRGYLLHFSSAKQAKTRKSRIEKAMPKIFEGKGYNER